MLARGVRGRLIAGGFAGVAVLLVPWTVWLNDRLPARHEAAHWDLAWTGFDAALAVAMLAVAICAARRSPWLSRAAAVAGTLLVCDAWFDVVTASPGAGRAIAFGFAGAELPLALLCFAVSAFADTGSIRGPGRPVR